MHSRKKQFIRPTEALLLKWGSFCSKLPNRMSSKTNSASDLEGDVYDSRKSLGAF